MLINEIRCSLCKYQLTNSFILLIEQNNEEHCWYEQECPHCSCTVRINYQGRDCWTDSYTKPRTAMQTFEAHHADLMEQRMQEQLEVQLRELNLHEIGVHDIKCILLEYQTKLQSMHDELLAWKEYALEQEKYRYLCRTHLTAPDFQSTEQQLRLSLLSKLLIAKKSTENYRDVQHES